MKTETRIGSFGDRDGAMFCAESHPEYEDVVIRKNKSYGWDVFGVKNESKGEESK